MIAMPYVRNRACAETATQLMSNYGDMASKEAGMRADQSRNAGNIVQFCRWRQIERLISMMDSGLAQATIH